MDLKFAGISVTALLLVTGCTRMESEKSFAASTVPRPEVSAAPLELICRLHWLGTRQVASLTNASDLQTISRLPESVQLKDQTLRKLSRAPWLLSHRQPDASQPALLLPLLKDSLSEESYLEIRRASNSSPHFLWAIRVDDSHAAIWRSNVISFVTSFFHARPSAALPDAWVIHTSEQIPRWFGIRRVNGWTLLGFAPEPSPLFEGMATRLAASSNSPVIWTSNYWFEIEADLDRLASVLNMECPSGLPKIGFSAAGDGKDLRIDGELNFPAPLQLNVGPWDIPTDLIDGSLDSFTAIRGLEPWLGKSQYWQNLHLGRPPNQAFCWALHGLQMQTYFAAPMANASNAVAQLTERVLQPGFAFGTNDLAGFQKARNSDGFEWRGLPYVWPYLHSIETNGTGLVFGGLFPNATVYSISPDTLKVLDRSNLVYYDWELTGERVEQWLYLTQFFRMVSHKSQLPVESAAAHWLKAIAPKLGKSLTQVTVTGPAQISVVRRSSVGLTGFELNVYVDWLEGATFPLGLHTFSSQ